MSLIVWLFLMTGVVLLYLWLDPFTRYWNSATVRAESMKTSRTWVMVMDAVICFVHLVLWFGIPSALYNAPPDKLPDVLSIPDIAGILWLWTGFFVVAVIGDVIVVGGLFLAWGTLAGARARMLRYLNPWLSRLIMLAVMMAMLQVVLQVFNMSLGAILASSDREPNYLLISVMFNLLGLVVLTLAMTAPIDDHELEGLGDQILALERTGARVMLLREMVATGQFPLPVMRPTPSLLPMPQNRLRGMLDGLPGETRAILSQHAAAGNLLTDPQGRYLFFNESRLPAGYQQPTVDVIQGGRALLQNRQ